MKEARRLRRSRSASLGIFRPRAGRDRIITAEAKTWLVALACRKAKELGYPHELWTTRRLAAHARQHGAERRASERGKAGPGNGLQDPGRARGQAAQEPALAKAGVRYYLEKRDPEFEPTMAEILCVYRQVAMLRGQAQSRASQDPDGGGGGGLAIVS